MPGPREQSSCLPSPPPPQHLCTSVRTRLQAVASRLRPLDQRPQAWLGAPVAAGPTCSRSRSAGRCLRGRPLGSQGVRTRVGVVGLLAGCAGPWILPLLGLPRSLWSAPLPPLVTALRVCRKSHGQRSLVGCSPWGR